jgi:hypothetical protein
VTVETTWDGAIHCTSRDQEGTPRFSRATSRRANPAASWDTLISCISVCGKCDYCRRGMYSHCTTGGWILGNQIDGTQAEYVRTPHADTSLYRIPTAPTRKLWPC